MFPSPNQRPRRRDNLGVPHIKAATIEDALFVQGYVTAQDRLWQMDILRRAAAGELSEVVGRATLEMDQRSAPPSHPAACRRARSNFAAAGPALSRSVCARGKPRSSTRIEIRLPLEFTVLRTIRAHGQSRTAVASAFK